MNIESAQYNEDLDDRNIKAVIDGTTYYVPILEDNRHYQAILEWVAKGNTIADAE